MINKHLALKFFIFGLLLSIATPDVAEAGQAGKYRVKGWMYRGIDVGALLPLRLYVSGGSFAIGFAPPIGLGIGTAVLESAGPFKGQGNDIIPITFFPLYIYWIPYMHWHESGVNTSPETTLYTFLGFSNWANPKRDWANSKRERDTIFGTLFGKSKYLRCGIGLWHKIIILPFYYIGVETGFISYKNEYSSVPDNSFYIGVNAGIRYWNYWVKRSRAVQRAGR